MLEALRQAGNLVIYRTAKARFSSSSKTAGAETIVICRTKMSLRGSNAVGTSWLATVIRGMNAGSDELDKIIVL